MQGFYFALLQYSPTQAFTARFAPSMQLYRQRRKTAHRALQRFFLRLYPFNRPRYKTGTSGYNTACTTLERITAPGRPAPIPDTTATPDAVQVSTAAYYNKVYKGATVRLCYRSMPDGTAYRRPCQPGGVSMLPTPGDLQSGTGQQSGRTGSARHPSPGGAVQQ